MTGRALVEGGRPGVPTEKAAGIDREVRHHGGLCLGTLNGFKGNWRLEPTDFPVDWVWG